MPGPLALLPLLATASPGLWQAFSGGIQGINANKVKPIDTRPQEFKEMLAMRRQQAGSAFMPGQASSENRINQNMAN
ncbi:hypothetical protein GU926_01945 [Nibribacter ruber]|uniref:Uncharacterized protein n=1 Tax=Nibribacter ruber TaxID=2698458 RepID=A0A6P1P038_9BACT|nr:hypothetical protein [Nibribacter ruber]QHL86272.1 hypothetical protein GU926_01945 [Nibribacter ruber]